MLIDHDGLGLPFLKCFLKMIDRVAGMIFKSVQIAETANGNAPEPRSGPGVRNRKRFWPQFCTFAQLC